MNINRLIEEKERKFKIIYFFFHFSLFIYFFTWWFAGVDSCLVQTNVVHAQSWSWEVRWNIFEWNILFVLHDHAGLLILQHNLHHRNNIKIQPTKPKIVLKASASPCLEDDTFMKSSWRNGIIWIKYSDLIRKNSRYLGFFEFTIWISRLKLD